MSQNKQLNPPKTFIEQLDILHKTHNLDGCDIQNEYILRNINYYTIKGYGLAGHYIIDATKNNDDYKFDQKTKLIDIYNLYLFDIELKNILIYAIGVLEKYLRTVIANTITLTYNDPECTNPSYYTFNKNGNSGNVETLYYVKRSIYGRWTRKEAPFPVFDHFFKDKDGHFPLWVIIESFTYGNLYYFYEKLLPKDKTNIANKYFSLSSGTLESWLYCIKYVRNICSHFNRLVGKTLVSLPDDKILGINGTSNNKEAVFSLILVLLTLLSKFNKDELLKTKNRITKLFNNNQKIIADIGFPVDWISQLNKIN